MLFIVRSFFSFYICFRAGWQNQNKQSNANMNIRIFRYSWSTINDLINVGASVIQIEYNSCNRFLSNRNEFFNTQKRHDNEISRYLQENLDCAVNQSVVELNSKM